MGSDLRRRPALARRGDRSRRRHPRAPGTPTAVLLAGDAIWVAMTSPPGLASYDPQSLEPSVTLDLPREPVDLPFPAGNSSWRSADIMSSLAGHSPRIPIRVQPAISMLSDANLAPRSPSRGHNRGTQQAKYAPTSDNQRGRTRRSGALLGQPYTAYSQTSNPRVPGSNPGGGAKFSQVRRLSCRSVEDGAKPRTASVAPAVSGACPIRRSVLQMPPDPYGRCANGSATRVGCSCARPQGPGCVLCLRLRQPRCRALTAWPDRSHAGTERNHGKRYRQRLTRRLGRGNLPSIGSTSPQAWEPE